MRSIMKSSCLATVLILSGCSTTLGWFGIGDDEEDEVQQAPVSQAEERQNDRDEDNNVYHASRKQLELKLAKVWARVDELENRVMAQKERMRVIEKGLMLGILPEELRSHSEKDFHSMQIKKRKPAVAPHATPKPEPMAKKQLPKAGSEVVGVQVDGHLTYDQRLALAQDYFQAGRYGRAIAEYSDLAKSFPGKTAGGSHKYWIALSWSQLREFETARQLFSEFISSHIKSAWIPRARYHLAKVEYKLGLRDSALQKFRKIIADYPNEDAAEMAKAEIGRMEASL